MRFIIAALLLFSLSAVGQRYDTLIVQKNYKSYFNYQYRNPTVLTYVLSKGGGGCSRAKFRFKNDIPSLKTATDQDYARSGFDRGHLANAEDFAYDCVLDELTFRYYNCVPQYPEMNRGPWKKFEATVRELSQEEALFIVCINVFKDRYISGTRVGVPTWCIKLVYSYETKKPITGIAIENSRTPEVIVAPVSSLISQFGLNLSPYLAWKVK